MFLAGFLVAFLFASRWTGSASEEDAPFVVASQGGSDDGKPSNLLPDFPEESPFVGVQSPSEKDPSDIGREREGRFGGYFYPKPSKPFYLPAFKALDATAPAIPQAAFAEDAEGVERLPRSPQRWRPYEQPPPPFIPGFIPPQEIRPLPALYGRPGRRY